ncbi:cytochrome c oxidase subunit I,coxAC; cytochrome c oxidase subunit I+III [Anaerolineales bacterium]|nr:cytochrome c oxidase subunit I,coxAC; cytochrome c oxidase subunit I+III [Anaerolineales bacterium]
MINPSPARGWVFFAVGLVAAYAAGVGLVFAVSGTLTYVHLVPILLATVVGATTMSWGFSGFSPLTKGFLGLTLGGLLGYALGLVIDLLVQGSLDWAAPAASLFSLLIGFTAFFLGVSGLNAVSKGLIWQIIGTLTGAIFVSLIRVAMGLEWSGPFLFTEPAWVLGAFMGVLFFLGGNGAVSDWFKWARGIDTPENHDEGHGWEKYLSISLDHKVIGIQYTITALFLISVGGLFALIFRTELAASQLQFLTNDIKLFGQTGPQLYNTFMSLHGMIMIISILLGIAGMMNYAVPFLLGAQDMAFPRLNAFSFWIAVPASVLMLMSLILGGFDTGWTGYPPLSARAPVGMQMFFLGVFTAGWSSILGALNIITTVLRMRAKGMTAFRMPIFVWAAVATSIIALTATQLIGLSFQLVMFQRLLGMGFFDPAKGGNPVLFQHLFWFYSHPAVYVFILPGLGIISELLPVFARKPLFGYRWIAMSSLAIALVGFLVWAHHMFTSGMNEYLRVPFMYSTLLVAIPTGVKFFSWVATLWRGKIWTPTPMLFVLGGLVVFLLGGLSGPPNATVSTDLHLHDTYFIVGHFHDTIFGGFVFPFFASLYYWFPKATGRRMNETLGKLHFWLMTPSFFVLTFGMMRIGLLGMRRRIVDYDPALGFDTTHLILTIAGFMIALSVLIFIYNFFNSIKNGEKAEGNVWGSRSPEWQVPSPLPVHNYDQPFEVVGEPYDYGLADAKYIEFIKPAKSGHK